MKTKLLTLLLLLCSFSVFAQPQFGIGAGLTFAKTSIPEEFYDWDHVPYYAFSNLTGPSFQLHLHSGGIKWRYYYDMSFSRAGFQNDILTYKVFKWELANQGIQYLFFDDWAKIRPVIQTGIGASFLFESTDFDTWSTAYDYNMDLQQVFDLTWSIGGGIQFGKHFYLKVSYDLGLLDTYSKDYEMKQRAISCSLFVY